MYKTRKRTNRGLVILLVFTGVTALLYIGLLAIFGLLVTSAGDPALASFPDIAKYYFDGTLQLFIFNYANNSNIAYFALSCFLYALIVCWIIFLIAAIIVTGKKGRKVLWWGVFYAFVNLLIYIIFAAGSQKYWRIVNGTAPFDKNPVLMFVALGVIAIGAIYFLLSIISYFWSIVESYRNPRIVGIEVTKESTSVVYEEEEEDDDEHIRRIVRDELIKNQPFKVIIVGNETKQEEPIPAPVVVEEAVKEPEPEPVKEEPVVIEEVKEEPAPQEKKVIFGTIDFWKVARTVWPQLDNPKPLPKEEKVEEVIPAPEEDEEGWNRNKRQPFFVRIITAEADTKVNYNEIKNEILSYGVKARLSRGGETFRLKDKKYVKIYLVGKTLKVYLALSPEDYKDSTIPIEDVGHRPNYAEMPLLFKVRSQLSVRRCKDLIKAAMEKDGLIQGKVKDTNWVDELRTLNATKAKKQKA